MLKIVPLRALKDNYIWAGVNKDTGRIFVVDPGDAAPVFDFLKKNHLILSEILVTHKHADHTGGIAELMNAYKDVKTYSHRLEKVSLTTDYVDNSERVEIGALSFRVIHIPGHTLGHVAYCTDSILFSGDTLFGAGCGRIFEGTVEQMFSSLTTLKALSSDVLMYCGHEYTLANLKFAKLVEPNNKDIIERIKQTEKMLSSDLPSLPSTMKLEKMTNPFFRCDNKEIIANVEDYANRKLENIVDVFSELRTWKNNF